MAERLQIARIPYYTMRERLNYTDEQLRRECVVTTYRASGPGGQHRNKTESAIRLQHTPSGVVVTAEERRSQHENAANALSRLREALAIQFREPLPKIFQWPETVVIQQGRFRVAETNAGFFHVLGAALDALQSFGGKPQDAAAYLGVSTSSLTRFLSRHPKAWEAANRIRAEFGLGRLKA